MKGILFAAVAAVLGASSASAVSYSTSISCGGSGCVPAQAFDGSLGTLTSVSFDGGVSASYSGRVNNSEVFGPRPAVTLTADVRLGFSIGSLSLALDPIYDQRTFASGFNSDVTFGATRQVQLATSSNLASFLATPQIVPLLSSGISFVSPSPAFLASTNPFQAALNGKLTYTYDARPTLFDKDVATAVPEPASWLLMIGGFGMVGATMRRARMRAIAAAG